MFKTIISFFLVFKDVISEISQSKIKMALVKDNKELKFQLNRLKIDINKIECIGCKKRFLILDDIGGVCKHQGEIFAYCKNKQCELDSIDRFIS